MFKGGGEPGPQPAAPLYPPLLRSWICAGARLEYQFQNRERISVYCAKEFDCVRSHWGRILWEISLKGETEGKVFKGGGEPSLLSTPLSSSPLVSPPLPPPTSSPSLLTPLLSFLFRYSFLPPSPTLLLFPSSSPHLLPLSLTQPHPLFYPPPITYLPLPPPLLPAPPPPPPLLPIDGVSCYNAKTVDITEIIVPQHPRSGDDVTLTCRFRLDGHGHRLYTKDESTDQSVVLKNVTEATSGEYKCEVIGEGPSFRTAVRAKQMNVIVPPQHVEILSWANPPLYRKEELVQLNCTSRGSKPRAVLTWEVNGRQVRPQDVQQFDDRTDHLGRVISVAGLRWRAPEYFQDYEAKVSCVASVGGFHTKASKEIYLDPASSAAFNHQYASAGCQLSNTWTILISWLFPFTRALLNPIRPARECYCLSERLVCGGQECCWPDTKRLLGFGAVPGTLVARTFGAHETERKIRTGQEARRRNFAEEHRRRA
ncbi:hypothetical protein C7M84_023443 [Penaeus vannamei]|uniref:Ig-like domain-containing protein n=1 Tax=Penaeus vannamei TaxID=6689 RepID=A0A3R7PUZ9_PENVA|nr:hypothetical protein C7M84_023443 [Penaeus vannamei]